MSHGSAIAENGTITNTAVELPPYGWLWMKKCEPI
jgi:hypothetical protein